MCGNIIVYYYRAMLLYLCVTMARAKAKMALRMMKKATKSLMMIKTLGI